MLTDDILRERLARRDFAGLFVDDLGWDRARVVTDAAPGEGITVRILAKKRDVVALLHVTPGGQDFPDRQARRRIEKAVTRVHAEHVLMFLNEADGAQIWQWVKREPGQPDRVREHAWSPGIGTTGGLREKLARLVFLRWKKRKLALSESLMSRGGSSAPSTLSK